MAQQASVSSLLDMTSSSNVVFLGEAGSGKSEIALNFAQALAELGGKPVHFFDLDMTKPLFRSRDRREALEALGVEVHYEAQFMDAPTLTGGVRQRLNDPHCCAVLDVGGDYIGARSIGGYAPLLNRDGTTVYYVINPFRPWSATLEPNLGPETTPADVAEGARRLWELVSPYKPVDYLCVRRELCAALPEGLPCPVLPIRLWLTYPWATGPEPDAP